MDYLVIYDATDHLLDNWFFPAIGWVFFAFFSLLVFSPILRSLILRQAPLQFPDVYSLFFPGFALVWAMMTSIVFFLDNTQTANASKTNTCLIVEGTVQEFDPMTYSGRGMERFTVNDVPFEYSDYLLTGGYNQTVSHGGQVTEGRTVRLCYIRRHRTNENIIVRVEVAN